MENILKKSLNLNLQVLRVIGLYPSEKYNHLHKCFAYIIHMFAVLPIFVLGTLNVFLDGEIEREKYNDFVTVGAILLVPKVFLFLLNRDNIQNCINYFGVKFPTSTNDAQREIIEECDYICRRNSTFFISCNCLALVVFFAKWYFDGYQSHLLINIWLPFNSQTHPMVYCCVSFTLVFGIAYEDFACAAIDPLVSGLLCHAAGQLKLLKENLQNLDFYVDEELGNIRNEIYRTTVAYRKIVQIVCQYQQIIHFVHKCESCFSSMVYSQFMESILAIGLCCLQLSKIQEFNIYSVGMVVTLSTLFFQVYFYCYYGSTMYEENNGVCTAAYMSNWYEYDLVSRRAFLILMERSKGPMLLTAAKVLDLSLETFTMILKTSYSLIAVLKNV